MMNTALASVWVAKRISQCQQMIGTFFFFFFKQTSQGLGDVIIKPIRT